MLQTGTAVIEKTMLSKDLRPGLSIRNFFPSYNATSSFHYLDSAATSQKPQIVIDALTHFLGKENANIHRGAYALSAQATQRYDQARMKVAAFINAASVRSIVFTKNATEAFNLASVGLQNRFQKGDTILLTLLEHHSNIVPWQILAKRLELNIEFVNLTASAELDLDDLDRKLKEFKPRLLAVTAQSNAFGSVTPIQEIIKKAHKQGALVVVDASQAIVHDSIDVQKWDADILCFTGHKLYGPTGIGVLYGKEELLEQMDPYQGGGDMIEQVTVDGFTVAELPAKFEAGTPPIAEAIALGVAIDFINAVGISNIEKYERGLFKDAFNLLSNNKNVELHGPATSGNDQRSIISFSIKGVHPHDFATIADQFGVQVRAGHHCAMPALKFLDLQSTIRASIGIYSDISDFEALLKAVDESVRILA